LSPGEYPAPQVGLAGLGQLKAGRRKQQVAGLDESRFLFQRHDLGEELLILSAQLFVISPEGVVGALRHAGRQQQHSRQEHGSGTPRRGAGAAALHRDTPLACARRR
jgi:hypothetical protein